MYIIHRMHSGYKSKWYVTFVLLIFWKRFCFPWKMFTIPSILDISQQSISKCLKFILKMSNRFRTQLIWARWKSKYFVVFCFFSILICILSLHSHAASEYVMLLCVKLCIYYYNTSNTTTTTISAIFHHHDLTFHFDEMPFDERRDEMKWNEVFNAIHILCIYKSKLKL